MGPRRDKLFLFLDFKELGSSGGKKGRNDRGKFKEKQEEAKRREEKGPNKSQLR